MKRPRQVVALGGGGFSMEPDNLLLDRYIVGLTGKERAKVCFLPTASGDAQQSVYRFHRHFKKLTKKQASHLSLTPPSKPDIRAHLLAQDAIYVGGGNTMNMLQIWKDLGVDDILREAYESGVIMAGISPARERCCAHQCRKAEGVQPFQKSHVRISQVRSDV